MSFTLTEQGFQVDKIWTKAEFAAYQAEIKAQTSHGYYQKIVILDREGKTLQTPGHHPATQVMPILDKFGFPQNLQGKSVLDIGCNAGFYATVAKLRGAARVLGLDHQPHYINHAHLVRKILGWSDQEVEYRVSDGHTLSPDFEKFDFVINTGVVYHLQNPMDFLCKVAAITRETMFLESEMLLDPDQSEYAWFIEGEYGRDASNWWIYGPKCLERMARAAGFRQVEFRGYIWKPDPGTKTPEGFLRQGRGVLICRKMSC